MRLLIVDDHHLFAEALCELLKLSKLDLEILAPCFDGEEILDRANAETIDIILLDINLGTWSGLDLLPLLKKHFPSTKVIILSMYAAHKFVRQAFKNGADGYLLKTTSLDELEECIAEVVKDQVFFGKGVRTMTYKKLEAESIINISNTFDLRNVLTRRELEILDLLMQAKTSKQIAAELYISVQTVSVHRKRIMKKLAVSNAAGLMQKVNEINDC